MGFFFAPAQPVPPELPALIDAQRVWSHAELARAAQRRAAALQRAGVRPGEVVMTPVSDPADLVLMQHALARLGTALLPVPADLDAAARDALLRRTGCEWIWPTRTDAMGPEATGIRTATGLPGLALLIHTSGSSGTPKVVMLTAAQLRASCAAVSRRLGLRAGDQWLCCLPLHHIGGLAIGYRCALAAAAVRLLRPGPGFDAAALARALADHPITHLSLVPPMLARLLDAGASPPPTLRVLLIGGQALHPGLARRAAAAGWPVYVSYGMSETASQVAVGPWQDGEAAGTRIGPPLPGVELDCGGSGAPGRPLRLRAPMLMAGYANPGRRPGDGLDDGWLTTSDLCRVDADGALRVFGRADELLVIGGAQVSPAAVEARLSAAPGVQEIAVVGVPHPHWGATLAACWSGPASADALADWCRAHLPGGERPRIFRRFEQLPRLASGKPDRLALARLAAA